MEVQIRRGSPEARPCCIQLGIRLFYVYNVLLLREWVVLHDSLLAGDASIRFFVP